MYNVDLDIIERKRSLIPPWKRGVVVNEGEYGLQHAAFVHMRCFCGIGYRIGG